MSAAKRGLGRGLDALLGGSEPALEQAAPAAAPAQPQSLPLSRLRPNQKQPRTHFEDATLDELAASIATQGLVQPLVVTPGDDGLFTIVAGERRYRAAQRAGLSEVPVVVREVADDRQLLELALVENLQREDLDPMEEAEAYRSLQDAFGLAQEAIAERVGKSRPAVANTLRLLRLPVEVRELLRQRKLTPGQARPLLAIAGESEQVRLAHRAVAEGLTARALEQLAGAANRTPEQPKSARPKPKQDIHDQAAAERLMRRLQTRVEIERRGKGGSVRIHFHSDEELIRLFESLTGGTDAAAE